MGEPSDTRSGYSEDTLLAVSCHSRLFGMGVR
jgi:hypothetical protein